MDGERLDTDSGYTWILLEQDADRIVSKYTRGKIHSKTYPS